MTTMTAKEALMQILLSEGVEYVFGLPGTTEIHFMDALEDHPEIKYILGLHECVAVAIADGYSRAAGKPGVVNLHTLPGLGAAMGMLINARMGGVPLVVTAGQQDKAFLLQEPGLSGDLVGMGRQFSKWSTEVDYAYNLAMVMRRAFKVATQAPTGPVFISLPRNVMTDTIDFEYVPNPPLSLSRLRPDQETINRTADLLVKARTPAIIAGNGIVKHDALAEVVKLSELIGAGVYSSWGSDASFPSSHPQYLGNFDMRPLREILRSTDVLVVIGTLVFKSPSQPSDPILTSDTKLVQIDSDPWEIGKNFPLTAGIGGDIKLALAELNDALEQKIPTEVREATRSRAKDIAQQKKALVESFLKIAEGERDNIPISVSRLMLDLADSLKHGTVIVDDSWSYSAIVRRYVDCTEPKSYHRVRGDTIGWGMPAALGIKLALPDRPVVAIVGDGGAMFSIQSLWTAAKYNIPVTYIICHNASYRMVKQGKISELGPQARGRFLGMELDNPKIDFCQVAQGMGVLGQKVERPEELKEILKIALVSDEPNLVEVAVDGTV